MFTPPEIIPEEYSPDTLTRLAEDIYSRIGNAVMQGSENAFRIQRQLTKLANEIDTLQTASNQQDKKGQVPMPVPTNLLVRKLGLLQIYIITCDPIEIIKYPHVRGFQFFASTEKGFTPSIEYFAETGGKTLNTFTGTHTGTASNHLLNTTHTLSTRRTTKYTDIAFWSSMSLNTKSAVITNLTDSSTATMDGAAWSKTTPWNIDAALSGGSDNTWEDGDKYSFEVPMSPNLCGQGPLPFAVWMPPIGWAVANSMWDKETVYAQARTFGRGRYRGMYSELASADTTSDTGMEHVGPTIVAVPQFAFYRIKITWTVVGYDIIDKKDISGFKLYRTTTTATPETTNLIYEPGRFQRRYFDYGYDTATNTAGAVADTQYYYWIRAVNGEGEDQAMSSYDGAKLGKPATPSIFNGEPARKPFMGLMPWKVQWTSTDAPEGYRTRYRLAGWLWHPWVWIPYSTENGEYGGNPIQERTFLGLQINKTYEFEVKPSNNRWRPLVADGTSDTQSYTITTGNTPAPPA